MGEEGESNRPLDGRHAVVTGGGRGIGHAIAQRLHARGARVTLMGRNVERLETVRAELPGTAAVVIDVTDDAAVVTAFEQARAAGGPIEILVNNAGAARSAPFERTTAELWRDMLAVNLSGAFLCQQQVIAEMRERGFGRIITIASTAGLTGYAYVAAYCAAKHGVIGLTRALALEVARSGVTVNAVCPGFTETDLLEDSIANIMKTTGRGRDEAIKSLQAVNPQRRFIQPDEVAATVDWLCSPGAEGVTGQAIAVAGGEVM